VSQNQAAALCSASIETRADLERNMKFRALGTLPGIVVAAALLIPSLGALTSVRAQTARPADSASMVKPPGTPGTPDAAKPPNASGSRAYNPDNMPTKRPALPANSNRMLHNNPASDAIAK
jgi:hypothetical protein